VVCNSLYGFTGSNIGPIPCIPIASSVTSIGRQCIEASREWIQTTFPVLHPEQEQYRAAGKLAAECVYGDTDSVFIKFNTAGADGTNPVAQAIGWAQELDKIVNDTSTQTTASGRTVKGLFDLPMYLEYEKTFYPFLLLKKKKYLAMKFVFDPQGGKVSASGIETVRRDNALFCSETMQAFIDKVLQDNDREGALTVVRAAVQSLLNEEVPVEKLILSKKLSKMRYKTMLPHATVRKTIAAREPSRTPMLGDRIPYVIAAGAKGTKNALLARDPAFFVADGEKANVTYYIDKQLRQPLERLMNPIYGRAVVLETFRLSTYARSESQSGGALAVHLGASGVRTIQPSVAKTIKTAPPNRPITDFF
jgi:DNA polymerase delta subunit 1